MIKSFTPLKGLATALLCSAALSSTGQVATTYSFSQNTGTYTAISGGTVLASAAIGNMDESVFGPISIPAFTFDGVSYTGIYVNTNGYITFGSPSGLYMYDAISGTQSYNGAIAAFCADLDEASSGTRNIRTLLVGSEYVIQWSNVTRYSASGERFSFQIRLNTVTNEIKIVYGGTITADSQTDYPEIGLRGPNNTFGTHVNNREVLATTGAWVNSTAGTSNTSTCYFNSTNAATTPTVGTTFIWSAPPVDISTSALVAPSASGCYGKTETVAFTIRNNGSSVMNFATSPITLSVSATGPNPFTFAPVTINTGTLGISATQTVQVSTSYDMSVAGTYAFNAVASLPAGDAYPSNNTLSASLVSHTPKVNYPAVSLCSGASATLAGTVTAYPYLINASNNTLTSIPDDDVNGVNSTITITGAGTTPASGVTAIVDQLTHTFTSDLTLTLVAPNGSSVQLSYEEGYDANFTGTVFTDAASTPIYMGSNPFTGSFNPESPFTGLTGLANGTWTLNIVDNYGGDTGDLNKWSLQFTSSNGISTYSWAPVASLNNAAVANPTVNPTASTAYNITVTDFSGCTNTASVQATVNQVPAAPSVISGNASLCAGSATTYSVAAVSGATSYTWALPGSWTGTSTTNSIAVVAGTSTGSVMVSAVNACGASPAASQTITVNALPVVNASSNIANLCSGQSATLTATGATTYSWVPSATGASIVVSPGSTTVYSVTGTNANGCFNTATVTQSVSICTGIAALSLNEASLNLFPNPTNGMITVSGLSQFDQASLQIFNTTGALVYATNTDTVLNDIQIDLSAQASGVYMVKIITGQGELTKRFVKN